MIIKGKFNEAIIYTDIVDERAKEQIKQMCNDEIFKDLKIRIMPDVHTGASCTIGTTMTIKDKIVPNMVGVDIGCGIDVVQIKEKKLDLKKLDEFIYANIPSGLNAREIPHKYSKEIDLTKLACFEQINEDLANKSIGSLGGGNHFIEVDVDEVGNLYLAVHSGSRHLGLEVAKFYQQEGFNQLSGNAQYQLKELIKAYKELDRAKEIQTTIERLKKNKADINPAMAYVSGKLFDEYIHDMKIIQEFAILNRKAMIDEILEYLNLTVVDRFTTIHNYIDTDNMILRKGAVSAEKNKKLLIPINMKDGSLICIGKGNEEWNCSAPHGAGRLLSRTTAKATLSMEEFEKQMEGIYTTSVNINTLDESPMAYKKIEDIIDKITPTVDIIKRIKPIYNFKASEEIDF